MNKPQMVSCLQELDRLVSAYESAIQASDEDAAYEALEQIHVCAILLYVEPVARTVGQCKITNE